MEFLVTTAGLPPFHFTLPDAKRATARPCQQAGDCCAAATARGGCLATAAIAPVLDYFSDVVSHARTRVACWRNGQVVRFEETGQRTALRLLLAGLQRSGCPFCGRFAALPADASLGDVYATFSRLLRSGELADDHDALFPLELSSGTDDAADLGDELETRLWPVLREARRRFRQDAAINAVIMMINGIRLAADHAREHPEPLSHKPPFAAAPPYAVSGAWG